MKLLTVPLQNIDTADIRYRISLGGPPPSLLGSIASAGMIAPPLLVFNPSNGRFLVVCGFRRLACAAELGWERVAALILEDSEADPRACLLRSYREAACSRALSMPEKAALVSRLLRVAGYSPGEVLQDFLPELQLPASQLTLDRLLAMERWPNAVRESAWAADLAPLPLLSLAEASLPDARTVVDLFCEYRWSHSRQREMLECLTDLARLRGQTMSGLIEEALSASGAADLAAPLPQRAERLRQWVRRERYPQLTRAEESYLRIRRNLRLPPGIALQEPADFEGHQYRIQFRFSTAAEFEESLRHLRRLGEEPAFGGLFDLL